jgi:superfamily II DNA or RNA helicase
MNKEEYNVFFDYIYDILENEDCTIQEILKRNLKKKYLLPQSFVNLFDETIIINSNTDISESKYYKYLDKISKAIKSIVDLGENIDIFKNSIKNKDLIPEKFWIIIDKIYNNTKKDIPKDILKDIPKDIYIERPNYIEFIKNVQEQNFKSGITIQATGTGKSFQILKLIDVYQQKFKLNKNDYLIIAPKIDILRDMFYKDDELNKDKFDKLKRSNIIDINKYNIVNLVTEDFNKQKFSNKKPNIILANMQYLIFMVDKNVAILEKNLKMCIFDECHNVSGDEIFKFIEKLNKVINIGFSATPLRNTSDKLLKKFYKIYGENNKINIISSFDIFDGISNNIILPFKHYFFEFKSCYKINRNNNRNNNSDNKSDNESDNDSIDSFDTINSDNISIDEVALDYNKQIVKNIMTSIIKKLPYRKIICWCRTKKLAKKWKDWFEINYKSYKTYLSISGSDNEENDTYLEFKHLVADNPNTKIKAILFCVGRCREGSDIDFVDCGIYLDPVKNRSVVVAMQTAGRIMRTDKYNKKSHAIIIEGYLPNENNNKLNADLIIGYYKKLLQISEDKNNYIDKLKYLHEHTLYDNKTNLIKIKIDDDDNHDCILNVELNVNDWNNIKQHITQYTKQQINIRSNKHKDLENNKNILLIKQNNFRFSKIKKAFINKKELKNLNYVQLVILCYKNIENINKIFEDNIINIIRGKKNNQGFKYCDDMDISIQGQDAKNSITEIVRQCILNKLSFDIEIELKNDNIIHLLNDN